MLILTRRISESIIINNAQIVVTVLGIKGNQVRIGVEAPKDVPVHRKEVWERIMRDYSDWAQARGDSATPDIGNEEMTACLA